jgi:murein DD-endopeptidase MepM/ murein hydrolase activator NlpD
MANIVTNLMGGMTVEKLGSAFNSAKDASKGILDNLSKATKVAGELGTKMKGAMGSISSAAGFGKLSLGAGQTGNVMSDSLGGFSTPTGAGQSSMMGAWGKFGSMNQAVSGQPQPGASDPRNAGVMLGNVTEGVQQMLPDMQATMTRATTYYNATMYAGNRFPRATNGMTAMMRNMGAPVGMPSVQDMTLGTINDIGGLTSVGADANVAKYLTGRGMNVSGAKNSTYQETLRTIAHAGKYLNISNEAAAKSIEGLTSAQGSSNMLRKFGIYTSDLTTGKEKTQGQIFEELAQRFTAGREPMSIENTLSDIRRGFLGVNIQNAFGNDQAGAEMFKQYMVERAAGSKMDLSDTEAMNKIYSDLGPSGAFGLGSGNASGNANPMNSLYALNSSETNQLDKAEQAYIQGITAAVQPLQLLNDVSGQLAATMAGVNLAFLSTMKTSQVYQGGAKAMGAVASWAGGNALELGKAAVQFAMGDYLGAVSTGAIPAVNLAMGTAGLTAMAATGLATTVAGGGLWMDNAGIVNNKRNPNNEDKPNQGGPTPDAKSSVSLGDTASGLQVSPIPGAKPVPGAGYNDKSGVYYQETGNPHMGFDLQASDGKAVYSVCDGKVIKADGDSKRYYIGESMPSGGTKYDDLAKNVKGSISLGQQVHIYHEATGYTFIYGHLSAIKVSKGPVKKGALIGLSGHSGGTTGPHLHFEVKDKNGRKINPKTAIAKVNATKVSPASAGTAGVAAGTAGAGSSAADYVQGMLAQGNAAGSGAGFFGATPQQIQAIVASLNSGDMSAMQGAVNAMVNLANGGKTPTTNGATTVNGAKSTGGNTVNIEVKIPEVTETEAARFAKLVKQYLANDTLTSNMGSY